MPWSFILHPRATAFFIFLVHSLQRPRNIVTVEIPFQLNPIKIIFNRNIWKLAKFTIQNEKEKVKSRFFHRLCIPHHAEYVRTRGNSTTVFHIFFVILSYAEFFCNWNVFRGHVIILFLFTALRVSDCNRRIRHRLIDNEPICVTSATECFNKIEMLNSKY